MIAALKADNLAKLDPIAHGFFTRIGGVSSGVYTSLNLGAGSADDPALVARNHAKVAGHFGVARIITLYQVHGAEVVTLRETPSERPRADAMVSDVPGLALGILTADCVPVLLADAQRGIVGAAHAGWKGALAGVVDRVVAAMAGLGARDIRAAVGPAISQENYEVGAELLAAFTAHDPADAEFFRPATRAGHYHFDLPGLVTARLKARIGDVTALDADTYGDPKRFFSYRRASHHGESDYGRQISVIVAQS